MPAELRQAILRTHAEHPEWGTRRVAEAVGSSKDSVRRCLRATETRASAARTAPAPADESPDTPEASTATTGPRSVHIGASAVEVDAAGTAVCPRCSPGSPRLPLAVVVEHLTGRPSMRVEPMTADDHRGFPVRAGGARAVDLSRVTW